MLSGNTKQPFELAHLHGSVPLPLLARSQWILGRPTDANTPRAL